MSSAVKTCQDLSTCFYSYIVSDYYHYLPDLIGDRFGMTTSDYRTLGIVFPLVTSSGSYLLLWTKCYGESQNYNDQPLPIFSKWSWTKIFTFSAPVVVVSQMWASIPYSVFNYPTDEYLSYSMQVHFYIHTLCNESANPVGDFLSETDWKNKRYTDTTNQSLKGMPSWLGKTALFYSIFISLQILGSCLEKRRFGKRDALMFAIQIATLTYSIFQIHAANQIDFVPYQNADLDGCKARYLTNTP